MSLHPAAADRRPTWAEIRVPALVANVRAIAAQLAPATRLMAVVKANAYGHGLQTLAPVWQDLDPVHWLGVAVLREALALREAGVVKPILVLGHTPASSWPTAARRNVALTLHSPAQCPALGRYAAAAQARLRIHVKVDTGLHRLGLAPEAVPPTLAALAPLAPTVQVEGLFTHFHSAADPDLTPTRRQLRQFRAVIRQLENAGLRPDLCHSANSAAALRLPSAHLDMVRVGGALYGLHPAFHSFPYPEAIAPVLTWHTRIAQLRTLDAGMGVGYDHAFRASRPTRLAVVPVGYADGLLRCAAARRQALVHGQAVPFVGNACMDQAFLDVSAAAVREGDEAILMGTAGDATLWSDDIARGEGTIAYDVATRIAERVPRIIVA